MCGDGSIISEMPAVRAFLTLGASAKCRGFICEILALAREKLPVGKSWLEAAKCVIKTKFDCVGPLTFPPPRQAIHLNTACRAHEPPNTNTYSPSSRTNTNFGASPSDESLPSVRPKYVFKIKSVAPVVTAVVIGNEAEDIHSVAL